MVGVNSLGMETVTIVRAPLATNPRDNSQFRDWASATKTDIEGCQVQPFLLSNKLQIEDNLQREFGASYFRVWLPAGTIVLYTDRLVHRNRTMDVYGQPGIWFDFEGVESHITVLAYFREG